MIQRFAAALALWACAAAAMAVPATSMQFQTNTVALTPDASDAHSDSSPAIPAPGVDPLPLSTQSFVIGDLDFASSGATAAAGLFATSAEAESAGGFASAASDARFLATYAEPGFLDLSLQFTFDGSATTGSSSLAGLSVLVTSGGVIVVDEFFTSTGEFDLYLPLLAAEHTIDIRLVSEASTDPLGGFATNAALLSFDVALAPVPEPGTWALLLCGGFVVAATCRRRANAASVAH